MGIGGVGGAEQVTFLDELFGCVGEVRDVSGWDEPFRYGGEDMAQLGLPRAGRWRRLKESHRSLYHPSEGVPVCFTEVCEGDARDPWGIHGKISPKVENYWEVVRVEGGKSSEFEARGYFWSGYSKVRC